MNHAELLEHESGELVAVRPSLGYRAVQLVVRVGVELEHLERREAGADGESGYRSAGGASRGSVTVSSTASTCFSSHSANGGSSRSLSRLIA